MLDPVKNLVYVTALIGYNLSATSIVLNSGNGAKLPNPSVDGAFNLVWYNHTDYKNPSDDPNVEIIRVTGRSGDTLTIARAQELTTASDKNITGKTYRLVLGMTAKMITDIQAALDLKATMFPGISAETPIPSSAISIDYATRVLTITPPLGYFDFFVDGSGVVKKFRKTGAVNFPAFTDTSGIWYFYFDTNGDPITTLTPWVSFDNIAPVYRILWNATLSGSAKSVSENLETHENTTSGIDHTWKHKQGTIWYSGFNIFSNIITSGNPNADGRNSVISLSTGMNLDDNLFYTITNSAVVAPWNQDLGNNTPASLNATNGGLFKVRLQSAGGLVSYIAATRFPFAYSAGNVIEYINSVGTRVPVTDKYFTVYYLYASQDPRNGEAVKAVSAPIEFVSLANAQAHSWSDIQNIYSSLNDGELRPLCKLIFESRAAYDVGAKKAALRQIDDIRKAQITQNASAIGAVNASAVIVAPAGNISSTNAQSALEELDLEKLALSGGSMSGAINGAKGTDIASAATTDIGAATGNFVDVTGTTTITALGTIQAGTRRIVRFTGALILTHNATSLILPTGANITTAAGDTATFISLGSGNWICANYQRKNGMPLRKGLPLVLSATSYTTDTGTSLNVDNCDNFYITAQAGPLKFNNPGGTLTSGRTLIIRIKGDGTARALTYDTKYRAMGNALPSTTVVGKTLYLGFIYNSTDDKLDLVATAQEA